MEANVYDLANSSTGSGAARGKARHCHWRKAWHCHWRRAWHCHWRKARHCHWRRAWRKAWQAGNGAGHAKGGCPWIRSRASPASRGKNCNRWLAKLPRKAKGQADITWQIRQREAELGGRFPQAAPPHFRVLRAKFHCHVPPAWRIFYPQGEFRAKFR